MAKAKLSTILAVVFVDLLGFSLILPLVPFYALDFGASQIVAGLLISSYAAAQLIGAPILGRLSDRFGRRPVLLVSIAGSALGFVMLGVAGSVAMLFASRVLDGLTGGNISVAQAYVSDITSGRDRARALGLIGAAFGLGFIFGPAIGGLLSALGAALEAGTPAFGTDQGLAVDVGGRLSSIALGVTFLGSPIAWQYALPAFVAAFVAALNALAVYLFLPESLPYETRLALAQRPRDEFTLRNLGHAFKLPGVGPLLYTRLFSALAFSTLTTVFSLYAAARLSLDAAGTSFILAYVGVLVAVVQGGGIGYLTARYDERSLVFASTVVLSGALLAWSAAPNLPILLLVLVPLAFSGGVLNTLVNSLLTKAVGPEEIGGALGLSAAMESFSRVVAPPAGAALIQAFGAWAPGAVGAAITGGLAVYVWRRIVVGWEPSPTAASAWLDGSAPAGEEST